MSAPPEVVFNTATDPDRVSGWLPAALRGDGVPGPELGPAELRARWRGPNWSARLQVSAVDAGGATVRLELEADQSEQRLPEIADESLFNLARVVEDNLTAG